MKMAKANRADLEAAMDLAGAFEAITNRWAPTVPAAIEMLEDGREMERFDLDDADQCRRVLEHLLHVANRGSLSRVVFGMSVLLDPRNRCVDPDADTLEIHPQAEAGFEASKARPITEYHEDHGAVLWWTFPIDEPPYCGQPTDSDWPGYHTHWSPLIIPDVPVVPAIASEDA